MYSGEDSTHAATIGGPSMEYDVQQLLTRLKQLEAENACLKQLLEDAGISYAPPARIPPTEITKQLARRFYSYFWGRTDVYSKRSVNKSTGKAGYYPQCENLWKAGLCPKKEGKKVKCGDCGNRKWRSLEAEQIMAHLRGEKPDGSDVIGIYPLFPDGTCRFLVFDFDNHEKGGEVSDFANRDDRWMEEVHARYVYGVTATPFRGDGLEKINEMLLGPVRFQYSAKDKVAEQGIGHYVVPRFTRTVLPFDREKTHVTQAYERLRENESRNEMIAADVKRALENGRTPVILTRFTSQAAALYNLLRPAAQNPFLLTGEMPKKARDEAMRAMANVPPEESLVLVATGQLVGEGFDFPRLDTLFLATPVSWKGVVEQYAGRLHRDYPGKKDVFIYDYVDSHIPVFDNMYAKRLRTYKRIGYTLCTADTPQKQTADAIYDSDSYRPIFEQDLREAAASVIISSPTLSRKRVEQLLALVRPGQENGLKVAVITWHPDVYRYGKDEHRLALLESLRTGGCEVRFAQDNCLHFAVIDETVVWYGSMNLLSRDDVEDNIMRLESREIAEELLGTL